MIRASCKKNDYTHAMKNVMTLVSIFVVLTAASRADWVQWGGNGHYYNVVLASDGISWDDANAHAQAMGGHLATLTSADENAFVFGLVDHPEFWVNHEGGMFGPWFGLLQDPNAQNPNDGWGWVTGETFAYSNWTPGEPNALFEHWGHFHSAVNNVHSPTWNNLSNTWYTNPRGFVVEALSPVPEPFSLMLGGIALAATVRRKLRQGISRESA